MYLDMKFISKMFVFQVERTKGPFLKELALGVEKELKSTGIVNLKTLRFNLMRQTMNLLKKKM